MKDFQIELQTTADGSTTLYRPDMDEHYHSVKGALTESQHIFIDCGLRHLAKDSLRVLEIGFGTGLNALLSALQSDIRQHYHTLELYPLPKEIIDSTDYHMPSITPKHRLFLPLSMLPSGTKPYESLRRSRWKRQNATTPTPPPDFLKASTWSISMRLHPKSNPKCGQKSHYAVSSTP